MLVLIVEPGRQPYIDPALVATTLGLTPEETQVTVWLAEGRTVREIAVVTGRKESSIRWYLRKIYRKLGISRQGGSGAAGAVNHRDLAWNAPGERHRLGVGHGATPGSWGSDHGRHIAARPVCRLHRRLPPRGVPRLVSKSVMRISS